MQFLKLTCNELLHYLAEGREVEFSLDDVLLFIGRDSNGILYLYDDTNQKKLCSGEVDILLSYHFPNGETLKDCIEKFDFHYIL